MSRKAIGAVAMIALGLGVALWYLLSVVPGPRELSEGGASEANGPEPMAVREVPAQGHVPFEAEAFGDPGSPSVVREAGTVDTLELKRFLGGPDDFGQIVSLRDVGDQLFVGDALIPPHVAVLDLSSGELVTRFGRSGEGPGEFRRPTSIRASPQGNASAWIHDFYNRRVSLAVLEGGEAEIREEVRLLVGTTTEDPVQLDNGWASVGLFGDDAVLMFFDEEGTPTQRVGAPPFSLDEVGHATGVRLLNRSTMAAHPSGTRLAVAFFSASRLHIYDGSGTLLRSIEGPQPTQARFVVRDGRFIWLDGNELAYTTISAGPDFIVAGFCGCSLEDDQESPKVVHVWSWTGDFLGEFHLGGHEVYAVTVGADGSRLFGSVEDPFPRVAEWTIPDALAASER